MKRIMAVCAIILCIPALCISEEFTVSNTFRPNTKIEAEKFNENFKDIEKEIAALRKSLNEVEENMIPKGTVLEVLPIGTIVPSMIAPAKINPNMKEYFIPCDGRPIPRDSQYFNLLSTMNISDKHKLNVPDLRGMFLRGLNKTEDNLIRDDGLEDPDGGDRTAGSYQPDALQQHKHKTNADRAPKNPEEYAQGWTALGYKSEGQADAIKAEVTDVEEANSSVETRPKNVAVYYYIKIN